MTKTLVTGATYAVTSATTCTVTDANGLVLCTAEPGSQAFFVATTPAISFSDPAAVVTATFNAAPAKLMALGLLGGGDKVDPFLKYAECVTVADMQAVNPDYKNDLTTDGEWIYPLPNLRTATDLFRLNGAIKHINFYAPNLTSGRRILNDCGKLLTVEAYMPNFKSGSGEYDNGLFICGSPKLTKCIIHAISENTSTLTYFASGCRSLSEFSIPDLPKLSSITNGFNLTQLDKKSILRLLGQLPTWTSGEHLATIGIHTDLQTDDEVIAAIENAEAKGWTLTVQWNGTATAQTASTFGLRKPVYAKVGNMVLPDGTAEQYLDWGHYVTNAEENGYMEFRSVEEAREYFGLPAEQDELLTNSTTNEHE